MTPEAGIAIGACLLLATAALTRGLALYGLSGQWRTYATSARVGAVIALTGSLIIEATAHGKWSPFDLWQVVVGLATVSLAINLGLDLWLKIDGASPAVDLITLALVLTAVLVVRPGTIPSTCAQTGAPFYIAWILFLLGAGAVIVAGSTGLVLALRTGLIRRVRHVHWPPWADLHVFLRRSTSLALVILGSGLTVSTWWAWRTVGTLTSGDPRETWIAITWLVTAMSYVARCMEKRWGRWTAGLAVAAASTAVCGILMVPDLCRLLGM